MPLGSFAGIDQLPRVIHRDGRRHFHKSVFAVLHRAQGHGNVPRPRSGDVNHINIVALNHLFPDMLGAAVNGRGFAAGLFDFAGRVPGAVFPQVANRRYFAKLDFQTGRHVRHAAIQSNDGHANLLQRRGRQIMNGLLAGRPRARHAIVARNDDATGKRDWLGRDAGCGRFTGGAQGNGCAQSSQGGCL